MGKMRALLPLLLLVGGGAAGAAGGYGAMTLLGPPSAKPVEKKAEATIFVPAGSILAPIVAADGHLSGYATFEVQLEVTESGQADVTAKLPLFLHAVNMRTYRSPMASGPDNLLPDIKIFRAILMEAAQDSLGKGAIVNAAVTAASPA